MGGPGRIHPGANFPGNSTRADRADRADRANRATRANPGGPGVIRPKKTQKNKNFLP